MQEKESWRKDLMEYFIIAIIFFVGGLYLLKYYGVTVEVEINQSK